MQLARDASVSACAANTHASLPPAVRTGACAACLARASAFSVWDVSNIRCRLACASAHALHARCSRAHVWAGAIPKAAGIHGFSWISYSSLPFLKTQLPSAAGAESEWPLHFTPEVASFQQWVSDPGVRTL